jgi:translation initiation factor 2B subunit (eIF-2B alpha/beta/delta family)
MKEAAQANKRFEVYITLSSPDNSGYVNKTGIRMYEI